MTLAITKKKIAGALVVTIAAIVAAEVFTVRAGWHILTSKNVEGCACAGGAGFTFNQWAILGFGTLFIVGWILGIGTYVRTLVATKKMLRVLKGASLSKDGLVIFRRPPLTPPYQGGETKQGLCEAFTFGILKPRIAICAHCTETLPQEEVQAMLSHEAAHAAARDPLWFLLLDVARAAFFFMPLIKQFGQWFRTAAELAADEHVGNRKALGGALLRTVEGMHRAPQSSLAISSFASQIEERIERLVNPSWYAQRRLHGASLFISLVILLGSIGSLYGGGHGTAEERLECNGQVQASPCARSFDGNPSQYYNGVSQASHSF